MPPKTYTWISLWFLLTAPIIAWDISYCLMRPRSMEGGDLHWFWAPAFGFYSQIDHLYNVSTYKKGDGFPNAHAILNLVETIMNLLYIYAAHVVAWPPAPLIGFTAAAMTVAKTFLYWSQEYFCGWCMVGHNSLVDIVKYWFLSSVPWVIVPSLILMRLGKDLVSELKYADQLSAVDDASSRKRR
ncbi:hypothetical protein R3P38DRAFT_2861094 [Favolaschia claudopus]|uniref:EXPERA domain-containing protein n=1 Tax=Favolaschia claudopus TaxID=2862362 RepID=A0AAW0DJ28_9AGAR